MIKYLIKGITRIKKYTIIHNLQVIWIFDAWSFIVLSTVGIIVSSVILSKFY